MSARTQKSCKNVIYAEERRDRLTLQISRRRTRSAAFVLLGNVFSQCDLTSLSSLGQNAQSNLDLRYGTVQFGLESGGLVFSVTVLPVSTTETTVPVKNLPTPIFVPLARS
jgi:hypothetical protein